MKCPAVLGRRFAHNALKDAIEVGQGNKAAVIGDFAHADIGIEE
jgi:hypothetical protein